MTPHADAARRSRTELIDVVFARLARNIPPTNPLPRPMPPAVVQSRLEPRPPAEWLREEESRLEEHTRKQFELLRQTRDVLQRQYEELASRGLALEEELLQRQKVASHQQQQIEGQSVALRQREDELARREAAVAAEVARLEQARQRAQGELVSLDQNLQVHHREWEERQEEWRVRWRQMERRLEELHQSEQAMQRRSTEFDELERQLFEEVEQREQELTRRLAEVARIAARGEQDEGHRQLWEQEQLEGRARRRELERRCADLERAEAALERRARELDELERLLLQEAEQRLRQPVSHADITPWPDGTAMQPPHDYGGPWSAR